MTKKLNSFVVGLGIASILAGAYWVYRDGDLLEIIPPFIIGIGLIGSVFLNRQKKEEDANVK